MTKREVSELFSIMSLAWPNAPALTGGRERLGATVELWAAALEDVSYAAAQRAMMELVRTMSFPPAVADVRKAVAAAEAQDRQEAVEADAISFCRAWRESLPDRRQALIEGGETAAGR